MSAKAREAAEAWVRMARGRSVVARFSGVYWYVSLMERKVIAGHGVSEDWHAAMSRAVAMVRGAVVGNRRRRTSRRRR